MDFEYAGIPVATIISMLLEVLKRNEYIKKETIPLISILLGLAAGIFLFSDGDIKVGVVKGLYLGLMPMGIYESVDNLPEKEGYYE